MILSEKTETAYISRSNSSGDSHQLNKRFHLRGQPFIPVVKQLAVHGYLALGDVEAGQAVGRQLLADDVFRQEREAHPPLHFRAR